MAFEHAATDVERFLLHTCMQGSNGRESQERTFLDHKLSMEPPLPSATITDLCNEPLFLTNYLSEDEEEEEAISSSSEADDMSFSTGTTSSGIPDELFLPTKDFEATLPELLAEECTFVEQQCNQAQVVTLVTAGRPKVVEVAKIEYSLTSKRRWSTAPTRRNAHSYASKSSASTGHKTSTRSRSFAYGMFSDPYYVSTPPLDADPSTPSTTYGPLTPETPNSLFQFDLLVSPSSKQGSDTASQHDSLYSLETRNSMDKLSSNDFFHSFTFPIPPSAPVMPVSASARSRRVPHPASSRSPSVTLPPSPRQQFIESEIATRPWSPRKESFGLGPLYQDKTPLKQTHIRRMESGVRLNKR